MESEGERSEVEEERSEGSESGTIEEGLEKDPNCVEQWGHREIQVNIKFASDADYSCPYEALPQPFRSQVTHIQPFSSLPPEELSNIAPVFLRWFSASVKEGVDLDEFTKELTQEDSIEICETIAEVVSFDPLPSPPTP